MADSNEAACEGCECDYWDWGATQQAAQSFQAAGHVLNGHLLPYLRTAIVAVARACPVILL